MKNFLTVYLFTNQVEKEYTFNSRLNKYNQSQKFLVSMSFQPSKTPKYHLDESIFKQIVNFRYKGKLIYKILET